MKKFDKNRHSSGRTSSIQNATRKSSLYARMSKKIDSARNYVQRDTLDEEYNNNTLDPNANRKST